MDLKSIVPENLIAGNTVEDQRIYNEMGVLKSFNLTLETIKQLDFETSYFKDNTFADQQLYHSAPYTIIFDTSHVQPLNTKIFIKKINKDKLEISMNAEQLKLYHYGDEQIINNISNLDFTDTVKFGQVVKTDFCNFQVLPKNIDHTKTWNSSYYSVFRSYKGLMRSYHRFEVKPVDKSTILKLSLHTRNVEKGRKFLDKLVELYLERSVGKKNEIAHKTLEFIDNQIGDISDSLRQSEKELEKFRSSQQLMDLGILTQNSYDQLNQLQQEKAEILIKLKYFDYLINYLKENKDVQQIAAPSSMGINDQLLMNLINKLSDLYAEKADMEINTKKENPYLRGLKRRIQEHKKTVIESVENLIDKSHIKLNDIDKRMAGLTDKVSQLPVKERMLFTYERQFELYNTLYTYLLKKRSETEIGKAANIPVHEILDKARLASYAPIAPKKKRNYLIAILLGFVVPGGFILLKDYFNDKITDIESIERITDYPILGHFAHKKEDAENIVYKYPRSVIAESFRSLRTNFQFLTGGEDVTSVLVTSSGQGEGKSFVSINLATSFALYEKKTVLVSFDLRRPNIYNIFDLKDKLGLSNYLSKNCSLEDIIYTTYLDKLDIVPAGVIPPNPSELIASDRTDDLFSRLKEVYDFIIIDTPPIGLVTDAFLLVRHTNSNLFIVRHNYTKKKMFESLIKSLNQKNISDVGLIVNDITLKNRGYEYHYGYNYNYAYY
jgi:capsular exopolysaccharide synthesis family protein